MKKSDFIKEHKKLIGLLSKVGAEGKDQAAELKRMIGGMKKVGMSTKLLHIGPSNQAGKKLAVRLDINGKKKTIHFGAKGMDDFTITKDKQQRKRYLDRHQAREDWTKSGVDTAGFWSRWVLWEKPTIREAVEAVKKKFKL